MPPETDTAAPNPRPWVVAVPVVALVAVGIWALAFRPVIFWTDGVGRLAHPDEILVWRWLPGLQLLIFGAHKLSAHPLFTRSVLLLVAALAAVLGGRFAARQLGSAAGLLTTFLIATNGIHVALATMPYQEPLFAGTLWLAFIALDRSWSRGAGAPRVFPGWPLVLAANAACLTRYEGWLLLPLLATDALLRARRFGFATALRAAVVTALAAGGVAAALWMLLGPIELLAREQTRLLDRLDPARLLSELWVFAKLMTHAMHPVAAAAALVGLVLALRRSEGRRIHWFVASFIACDVALCAVIDPMPAPRQPYVASVLALPYAAAGLIAIGRLIPRVPKAGRLAVPALLALLVGYGGIAQGLTRLGGAHRSPQPAAATKAGQRLGEIRQSWDAVVVVDWDTASHAAIHVPLAFDRFRILDRAPVSAGDLHGHVAVVRLDGAALAHSGLLTGLVADLSAAAKGATREQFATEQNVTVTLDAFVLP